MAEILKTNVCCLDLPQECLDFLKEQDLNVYEGSLGSVFHFDWSKTNRYYQNVVMDVDYPKNFHEYHVFVVDTTNAHKREYHADEHKIMEIDHVDNECLVCVKPVTVLDLRPYGAYRLANAFQSISSSRRIEVVFVGDFNEVEYYSSHIKIFDQKYFGKFNNLSVWGLSNSNNKVGRRTKLTDTWISKSLFESRRNALSYHHTFILPTKWAGGKEVEDDCYISILDNEDGECVSYVYAVDHDFIRVILPNVEDKAGLLKDLFENVLFRFFSDFFPDIESRRWIHDSNYLLPDEKRIKQKIETEREKYEQVLKELEEQEAAIGEKNKPLKQLLTETGSSLVSSAKFFLEWLGFENVIDKDETLAEGELKEEDICFDYEGTHVLREVKGINGTSTDAECSQIDKIVSRRMRQLKTTEVHGIYIVNNQKNIEPLKRCTPPFNETQINDAELQGRTIVYTVQLFALYYDIENGYITKEQVRHSLMQPGLADFHKSLTSLGVPYHYYKEDTVICLELTGDTVRVGGVLFYKDELNRLIGCIIESIEQDKTSMQLASQGKVGIKVNRKIPRGREMFKLSNN